MNKDSGEKQSGELSDESFDFKHITWKVSNVLTLPDLIDYKEQSPTFSFAGATWRIEMYPYGQTKFATRGFIDIMFVRLISRFPDHGVIFKFSFMTKHGKEFQSYSSSFNISLIECSSGVIRYLKKSIFMNNKNFLAPEGILTIICEMRTKKIPVTDRYCQIDSTASFWESPARVSRQEAEPSATTCKESSKDSKKEPESTETYNCIGSNCGLRQLDPLSINKTLRDLKELFLKQEGCDVIIKVKEQEFRAHKTILIARSPVFASTFRNDMKEKSTGLINIEDCEPSSFSDFLCFLYCGTVEILTTENVYSLFTSADKYDVQDLRSECLEFMKRSLSVDTFCETVTLALQHLEKDLIELATDFFAKHLQEIIVTIKWQRFVIDYPVQSNEIMIKALVPKKM